MSQLPPPNPPPEKLSELEHIKLGSNFLRGTIVESLADRLTASVPDSQTQLLKFHGTYQQDDRDLRNERMAQKLEPAYSFMLRVRASGGGFSSPQWLVLDQLANEHGDHTIRLTTRQSLEIHAILKWNLRDTIRRANEAGMTTLATCGDVNRNVMCNPNPYLSAMHAQIYDLSNQLAEHLMPKTSAYRELWLDDKPAGNVQDYEPLYGPSYLPRKFKIGIAVPPSNDVDVFTQDLGFVAIVVDGQLEGFSVLVGGGMGSTHGEPATHPILASCIGFCSKEQVLQVAETVATIQRDFGDRINRKHARLKYTIEERGIDWFVAELNRRLGWNLEAARPYKFDSRGDRYGWVRGTNDRWHLTLYLENGRICDTAEYPVMTGLREIAKIHTGDFRLTANQNLIVGNIEDRQRPQIEKLVAQYKLSDGSHDSALRRNAMACVALSMCGLAMAESERYMPQFLNQLEELFAEVGLADAEVVVRMTGCPNGCARPFVSEIALVGKAPGHYNLYLGGDFVGQRLNKLYRENFEEAEIFQLLRPIIARYAKDRQAGERFGDFVMRDGCLSEPDRS
ncbi:MAG: assimilatory sulfite reductase (NADPH) hemoprotein subunit [Thermoguttaceae bacterium]